MNLKDHNITSVEILDRYNALLTQHENDFFSLLNKLLDFDRELTENDEWNDKIHYRFTEEYITQIQSAVHRVSDAINESRNGLNFVRQQYPQ